MLRERGGRVGVLAYCGCQRHVPVMFNRLGPVTGARVPVGGGAEGDRPRLSRLGRIPGPVSYPPLRTHMKIGNSPVPSFRFAKRP